MKNDQVEQRDVEQPILFNLYVSLWILLHILTDTFILIV